MPRAEDYQPDTRIFSLFCGRSGDGKSTAAASFPRPLLDLDFDFRYAGIDGAIKQGIYDNNGIEYQQFNPRGGWDPIEQMTLQWDIYRKSGNFQYKTIIVDSLTSLTRLIVIASHMSQPGKNIGKLRVSGPGDFNFESHGTHQFFDYLRVLPCHILCSAHIIDKYGKLDKGNQYSETGIVGEKLSIRDNLGENVLTYFDNVYRFSREVVNGETKYYVDFATDLAKNSHGIKPGKHDITGVHFYNYLQTLIKK